MQITIDSLASMGAFSSAPVEKQIEWENNGETFSGSVFVRPLSYHSAVNDLLSVHNRGDAVAGRIASCICDKDGKPVFTVGDITGDANEERGALNAGLTIALLNVIAEVSGVLGKPQSKKNSLQKKKSGTN